MTQHIGIIACSAESAALCYTTIWVNGPRYLGQHAHPKISMHAHSLARYVEGVGNLMLSSAVKLSAAGAEFQICPDNTIHQAMDYVAQRFALPWLHIVNVVAAAEAAARGYRRIGLLGTRWLVESDIYPKKLRARQIECIHPEPAERERLGQIIMTELVRGVFGRKVRPIARG